LVICVVKKKVEETHDACVLAIAEELKKDNWEVKANLEGFSKPSKLGSLVPDVEAKKPGCLTRICDVATLEMFDGDKKRFQELKNYCAEYDFHIYRVDKDGKRLEVDPQNLAKAATKKG
jgi:hypothetical protein